MSLNNKYGYWWSRNTTKCAVIRGGFSPCQSFRCRFHRWANRWVYFEKNLFPKNQQSNKELERTPVWWWSVTCIKAWLLWTFAPILSHCFKESPKISIDRWQMCNGKPLLKFTDVPRLHFLHGVWPLIIKIPWTFWYTWMWKLHLKIDYRPSKILFTSDWPSISAFLWIFLHF